MKSYDGIDSSQWLSVATRLNDAMSKSNAQRKTQLNCDFCKRINFGGLKVKVQGNTRPMIDLEAWRPGRSFSTPYESLATAVPRVISEYYKIILSLRISIIFLLTI